MLDVRANYPNKSESGLCPVCKETSSEDTQEHILNCPKLCSTEVIENNIPSYQDLFKNDPKKQLRISRIIDTKFRKRKKMIKNSPQPEEPSEPLGCSTVL